jgi:hypothetical protein
MVRVKNTFVHIKSLPGIARQAKLVILMKLLAIFHPNDAVTLFVCGRHYGITGLFHVAACIFPLY